MFGSLLLLVALLATPSQTPLNTYQEPDAYEVYAAILPSEWTLRDAHAKQLVIQRETRAYKMCLKPDKESEARIGSAISAYVELNKTQWLLQPRFSIEQPYQFLEIDKFKAILGGKWDWDNYYRQYPESGGLMEFSAVGFNQDKTVAVVYMGHMCGGLCGGGSFHVLEKVDGKWKPLKWNGTSCAWAS